MVESIDYLKYHRSNDFITLNSPASNILNDVFCILSGNFNIPKLFDLNNFNSDHNIPSQNISASGEITQSGRNLNTSTPHSERIYSPNPHEKKTRRSNILQIGFLNICHLLPKVDQLQALMNNQETKINVFALNETFLTDSIQDYELAISGYNIIRKDRKGNGGGVAAYIEHGRPFLRHPEYEVDVIEAIWIELILPHIRNVLLCIMYRPPDSNTQWYECFHDMLLAPFKDFSDIIIVGDFNINLLDKKVNRRWQLELRIFNLTQMVTVATRQTESTMTLIDHVYTTNESRLMNTIVPQIRLSDHFPIFFTWRLNNKVIRNKSHRSFKYRAIDRIDTAAFKSDLRNMLPIGPLPHECDVDKSLSCWHENFINVLNLHAPKKAKRVKREKQPRWFNKDINNAIKMRDRTKIKDPTAYRFWRNKVTCMIRAAKQNYFKEAITSNKGDSKAIWKVLRDAQSNNTGMVINHSPNILKVDGKIITDTRDIVEAFNKYFIEVCQTYLVNNQHNNCDTFPEVRKYVNAKLPQGETFNIPRVTEQYVLKYLQSLDPNKATGLDEISAHVLKISAIEITPSITRIINQSIDTDVFPCNWKEAKVIPSFKTESRHDLSNYRPIAILPILSKIIEKHVHLALSKHLNKFDLLRNTQSGFREKHSCETALLKVVDQWMESIDKGYILGTVFLDLSKAFDLVNHEIMVTKLRIYGVSSKAINWFKSYLVNRSQCTYLNGVLSSSRRIACGVPQGSILGPLLFLIYINDIDLTLEYCSADMYADDTTFYASDTSTINLNNKLQRDMEKVSAWCDRNKMAINTTKTKVLLMGSGQRLASLPDNANTLSVTLGGKILKTVKYEELLGVKIDNNLSWHIQVDNVCKTVSNRLALLRRIQPYIDLNTKIIFYNGYVRPILDYCSIVWGTCGANDLQKLLHMQKAAARIITNSGRYESSTELFKMLKWHPVDTQIRIRRLIMMYKTMNGLSPNYLTQLFNFTHEIHNHNLRSTTQSNLYLKDGKTEYHKRRFSFIAAKEWNSLPAECKHAKSLPIFKRLVNEFFKS